MEKQLDDIERGIDDVQASKGEQFTVKQLMKTRKAIKTKLEKLNDTKRKDTVIDFEQLGVDRLFIDESHFYKNLYLYTTMRNVGGIAQTEAQKSSDLFMKCRFFFFLILFFFLQLPEDFSAVLINHPYQKINAPLKFNILLHKLLPSLF